MRCLARQPVHRRIRYHHNRCLGQRRAAMIGGVLDQAEAQHEVDDETDRRDRKRAAISADGGGMMLISGYRSSVGCLAPGSASFGSA
jgi:hypothetical protein